MKCKKCDKEITEDSKYCPYCGGKIDNTSDNKEKELRCKNCNEVLNEGDKFCQNCGTSVNGEKRNVVVEDNKGQVREEEDKVPTIMALVSLGLFFLGGTVARILLPKGDIGSLSLLFPLAGLVLVINAKIRYPRSIPVKVAFWLIILAIVALIVFWVLLMLTCNMVCGSINGTCA